MILYKDHLIHAWQEDDGWLVSVACDEYPLRVIWFDMFDTEQEAIRAAKAYIKEQQT